MDDTTPVVDVAFTLRGGTIPADHGYALFSAIARHLPSLHGSEDVGIHSITGRLVGSRQLALTRMSRLTIRLPANRLGDLLMLIGQQLSLDGSAISVGAPAVRRSW